VDVADVIARARVAQAAIDRWTAEQVEDLTTAVAYAVARKDRAEELARMAVDEAGFGNYADKVTKIQRRVLGVLSDLRATPSAAP
jgi:sulfoacetaldehyde dehydrogenase